MPPSNAANKRVILVAVSVLATLLLLEIGVRVSDVARGRGFFWGGRNLVARAEDKRLAFRAFGWKPYRKENGRTYLVSTHGDPYPLAKPEGTTRIVAFGGSTTENHFSARKGGGHYPRRLESLLNERLGGEFEVINVAYSAYATPHSLILLALDVISWDADIVILSHNYNDLNAAYFPDFTFDYQHKYGAFYASNLGPSDILFQHSQLYWLGRKQFAVTLTQLNGAVRRRPYGQEPPPAASAVFQRNLQSFVTLAQANGIGVLLATQALEPSEKYFQLHVRPKLYNKAIYYPLHDEFLQHHDTFNRIIRQVAAESGAWLLDNDRVLGGKTEYFIDFVHYSVEGVAALAESYADFLAPRLSTQAVGE